MSHIFDALQRSEAETSGSDHGVLLEATELLKRAELRATTQWEAEADLAGLPAAPPMLSEPALRISAAPAAVAEHLPIQAEPAPPASAADIFARIQSHNTVLTSRARLVCLTDPDSLAAEAFRLLGVRLRHLRRDRQLKKVLITSTIPQEGKSMVAANLACSLAQTTRQRTLVIEGDLRRPSLTQLFGLGGSPGLCEWVRGTSAAWTSIYHLKGPGFWIAPAGSTPVNPLELLQSKTLSTLMEQIAGWFEWIIIDSPPVLPLADTSVWARMADGILLVTRQGTTQKKQLQRGIEALEPRKLIGALLNSSVTAGDTDYYYRPTPSVQAGDGAAG